MVSDGQTGTAPLDVASLDLILTPHGHLVLAEAESAAALDRAVADRLRHAFESGAGGGLLQLGAGEVQTPLPPTFGYWRDFSARFVTAICAHPEAAGAAPSAAAPGLLPCPEEADLAGIVAAAPPMAGAEYLTPDVLRHLWAAIGDAFASRLAASKASVQDALRAFNPAWNTVGRVHFHLARTAKTPTRRSRSWPPTRTPCRPTPRRSTCRSGRPCASTPAPPTRRACSRCSSLCSARPTTARG